MTLQVDHPEVQRNTSTALTPQGLAPQGLTRGFLPPPLVTAAFGEHRREERTPEPGRRPRNTEPEMSTRRLEHESGLDFGSARQHCQLSPTRLAVIVASRPTRLASSVRCTSPSGGSCRQAPLSRAPARCRTGSLPAESREGSRGPRGQCSVSKE